MKTNEKKLSRSQRRFINKVNGKLKELVNAWFKIRMKLSDPDGQEAIDALNKYNNLWRIYCGKKLRDPAKYINKFLDVCNEEDKKMRAAIIKRQEMEKFNNEWKDRAVKLESEGMNAEQIAAEFDKFAQERNLPFRAQKKEVDKVIPVESGK